MFLNKYNLKDFITYYNSFHDSTIISINYNVASALMKPIREN